MESLETVGEKVFSITSSSSFIWGKRVSQDDGSFIDFDTSPIIFGACGTEGQHSYFQAIHQGTVRVPIEYIGFLNSQKDDDQLSEGTTNQEKLLF